MYVRLPSSIQLVLTQGSVTKELDTERRKRIEAEHKLAELQMQLSKVGSLAHLATMWTLRNER